MRGGEDEHLGADTRHPSRREVEDANDLAVDQILGPVIGLQRGHRPPQPQRAEIDRQEIRRFACLGQVGDVDDQADTNVEALEVLDGRRHVSKESTSRAWPRWYGTML